MIDSVDEPGTYFPTAERQATPFLPGGTAVAHELMKSILFEDHVVIPDSFLFNSAVFAAQAFEGTSLFLEAIQAGVVRTAFRLEDTGNHEKPFAEALRVLGRERIQGIPFGRAEGLALRLDRDVGASRANGTFKFKTWPSETQRHLGREYRDLVKKVLQATAPVELGVAEVDDAVKLQWQVTERWRWEAIDEAIAMGDPGELRRGDLYSVVARRLAIGGKDAGQDAAVLLGAALARDPVTHWAVRSFLQWVNDIYYVNQGSGLNSRPLLPACDDFTLPIIAGCFSAQGTASVRGSGVTATLEVELPPPSVLATIRPEVLLAIRASEGKGYRTALAHWRQTDGTAAERNLQESATAYARELTKQVQTSFDEQSSRFRIGLEKVAASILTSAAAVLAAVQAIVNPPGPVLPIATACTAACAAVVGGSIAVYRWPAARTSRADVSVARPLTLDPLVG
jgi:hypothetical protein